MPQLGSCASSGRAWRLRAARHSQEEADPLGAQPLPRVLEPAASKAADFSASDHPGVAALQNPEAAKLLAQMRAPGFPAEMDLQVGDLPWAGFKRRLE